MSRPLRSGTGWTGATTTPTTSSTSPSTRRRSGGSYSPPSNSTGSPARRTGSCKSKTGFQRKRISDSWSHVSSTQQRRRKSLRYPDYLRKWERGFRPRIPFWSLPPGSREILGKNKGVQCRFSSEEFKIIRKHLILRTWNDLASSQSRELDNTRVNISTLGNTSL